MMKKYFHFLLLTLTIFLAACNFQTVEQYREMEEQQLSKEVAEQEHIQAEEIVPEESVVQESEAGGQEQQQAEQVEQQPTTAPVTEKLQQEEQKPVTTEKPQTNEQPATQPAEQQTTTQKPQTTKPKSAAQQKSAEPQSAKKHVTVSIQVHSLLKHWDMLHPSLRSEKYVPSSGFILTPKTYEILSEKETVWSILQRAAKEHNIQIEYEGADENLYSSVYIEGIHHLYEFSAGPLSGWMYKVNDTYPSYGASQYKVQDGDVIEWHYTVDLGRDLGAEGA